MAISTFIPITEGGSLLAKAGFFAGREMLDIGASTSLKMFGAETSVNYAAHNAANALRMKTTFALQEAGILDELGKLTNFAVDNSTSAMSKKSVLANSKVISELTKDGSDIKDWAKLATPSTKLSTGQKIQVHYYKNRVTGEINYNIDFKVQVVVYPFPTRPVFEPKVPSYSP